MLLVPADAIPNSAQIVAEQLGYRKFRVINEGEVAGFGKLLQEAAADGCFAGAHIPSQQDEATVAVDTVNQMGKRLLMLPAHVQVARIRRDGKGRLA
jgi:hypothetical protein